MSKGVLDGIFFHPDCPVWANYAAVDKNGEVWFFELEPVPGQMVRGTILTVEVLLFPIAVIFPLIGRTVLCSVLV